MKLRGWFVRVLLGFSVQLGCSGPSVTAGSQPKSEGSDPKNYSVTQLSASQPDRASRDASESSSTVASVVTPAESCDTEECTGELSSSAAANLREAAAKTRDCYEQELKDHPDVEGRWTVLVRVLSDRSKNAPKCPLTIEKAGFSGSEAFKQCLNRVMTQTEATAIHGCVDVALPLSFVRQEVEAPATGGAPSTNSTPTSANPRR
jgi:hypothetical protein